MRRNRISGFDDGKQLLQVAAKEIGFHEGFPGMHPQTVAANGVDLPVVGNHPERLGQIPGRKSIGAESGMDQGNGALKPFIRKVSIITDQLAGSERIPLYTSILLEKLG